MIKKKKLYETTDGSLFDTKEEAKAYEASDQATEE